MIKTDVLMSNKLIEVWGWKICSDLDQDLGFGLESLLTFGCNLKREVLCLSATFDSLVSVMT